MLPTDYPDCGIFFGCLFLDENILKIFGDFYIFAI